MNQNTESETFLSEKEEIRSQFPPWTMHLLAILQLVCLEL